MTVIILTVKGRFKLRQSIQIILVVEFIEIVTYDVV